MLLVLEVSKLTPAKQSRSMSLYRKLIKQLNNSTSRMSTYFLPFQQTETFIINKMVLTNSIL